MPGASSSSPRCPAGTCGSSEDEDMVPCNRLRDLCRLPRNQWLLHRLSGSHLLVLGDMSPL